MTLEEAGEIVLRGNPWMPCPTCFAKGRRLIDGSQCVTCLGECYYLPVRTEEAYDLCGVDIPPRPGTIGFQAWEEIGIGFINTNSIQKLSLSSKEDPVE